MSATGRALTERHAFDAYSTPAWCTEAIAREIVWGSAPTILEPCCGEGAIIKVVHHWAGRVHGIDIQRGQDFLTWNAPFGDRFDFVITNPPFSLAQEFIEKSLTLANCVVMLLRLNFLASAKRKEFWERNPWTGCGILTKRPSFTGKGTDATDYAWFIWDKTGRQRRGMFWL